MMEKFLIIIPFLSSEAQGRELELAVAGWRRHFLSPHHICIVGDEPDFKLPENATWLECPRIAPVEGQYLPHLDIIHKIDHALQNFPEFGSFIYACDDIYAVNDFDIEEVMFPKVQDWVMPVVVDDEGNGWWRDLAKTREECQKWGYDLHNWVCHLPVCYDRRKYLEILERHGCRQTSFVVENLYFNAYYSNRVPLLLQKGNNLKWPVQGFVTDEQIECAMETKIWLYNSVGGWSEKLEERLRRHYGII